MAFSLRRAEAADANALTACIDAAYAGYVVEGIDLPPVSEGVSEDIRDNIVWLAVDGDRVLGGVILSLSGEVAHLMNVAVDPDQSGDGIGRALIDAAITAARKAGHTTMELATHKDMPQNVTLYQHLGWEVIGEDGNKIFMAYRLDDPSRPQAPLR
ncbi:GNAT family N-acetyltransferase [uncultured Roseovarius sp.]|uniref:GNAT family N-acetyltransferase n=1 Tax=uncultured Roseovarius sp. TaxID=293344 RepID=UPI00262B7962|nr:GNAT family N-acetyltransferase [uncultured Roseovarius sp.]